MDLNGFRAGALFERATCRHTACNPTVHRARARQRRAPRGGVMTFQEALDLREDAFVGMSLDALRELREADRVIDRVAEERFARWQHEQAMLTRPLALV